MKLDGAVDFPHSEHPPKHFINVDATHGIHLQTVANECDEGVAEVVFWDVNFPI